MHISLSRSFSLSSPVDPNFVQNCHIKSDSGFKKRWIFMKGKDRWMPLGFCWEAPLLQGLQSSLLPHVDGCSKRNLSAPLGNEYFHILLQKQTLYVFETNPYKKKKAWETQNLQDQKEFSVQLFSSRHLGLLNVMPREKKRLNSLLIIKEYNR